MKFCRFVTTGGLFGQPAKTRTHCLLFERGIAHDNANTFFGNPPESFTYDIQDSKIINIDTNEETGYELKNDTLIITKTGAVLERVK
ncbi:MAG: hypothetical protein A2381_08765 [Bdellovibrionales bacterium RIFOXYB1_FULL_37_110]|nr:MAG: hypothetical protein A2181_08960 [Bdellovibrionales bacterium RIFOXYA1_FULL_38_20]OFZ51212.1 MAG: hypothetical protein A2417_17395 [Bdellovibrionales bacterium RIFOXYC1_FULL_37_79]OFZ60932.1 MAG: hypothetical protein A2381_08765 [Bdellovibrionales bacterium RIFOXYB1_FULL_37_110]OFZ63676.1 MAG: hypothetical protein A2577_07885 [Bdellovibrionales bacterium RIFOXYD1_FULL_36_51]